MLKSPGQTQMNQLFPPSTLIYVRPIEPRRSTGSNELGSSGLHWKIGTRVTSTHQPVEEEP
ncbi:hypothetical protein F2Q68_00033703 [Brassica cretica]|uniref:Uncharacterized protein n=1 Tax=Brassica cretica TaxID=69181 RepID=A0A8S9GZ92_BRACR|nr:hypothetical protein F2Q68_00033703 [Brassica cretica]